MSSCHVRLLLLISMFSSPLFPGLRPCSFCVTTPCPTMRRSSPEPRAFRPTRWLRADTQSKNSPFGHSLSPSSNLCFGLLHLLLDIGVITDHLSLLCSVSAPTGHSLPPSLCVSPDVLVELLFRVLSDPCCFMCACTSIFESKSLKLFLLLRLGPFPVSIQFHRKCCSNVFVLPYKIDLSMIL